MPTNFPGALDSYVDKVDNVDDVMAAHINDPQDAIEAIEAKVGVDASDVVTAFDYFLKHASGAYRTHKHDGTSDDGAKLPKIDPAQSWGKNICPYSPGQVPVDGAEPQGWDSSANCTFTDEDAIGEGIPDITERVYKGVTTADDKYGYRTLTFADESLLDAGQTVVSVSMKVLCSDADKASIGIYGANLGLQESSQHSGGGAWETLTVEAKLLNAGDASIELRCIVDTGTAYFTMPMLTVGPEAQPWKPRDTKVIPTEDINHLLVTGDTGVWTSTDCTANSHPLATAINVRARLFEPNGSAPSKFYVGHCDTLVGGDVPILYLVTDFINRYYAAYGSIICDDSQVIRYYADEADNDNDLVANIYIGGYWMWE